jgi:hypothetical protein
VTTVYTTRNCLEILVSRICNVFLNFDAMLKGSLIDPRTPRNKFAFNAIIFGA